ncbi:something about silencing protein 10-like [Portunus trituberculatus]|uniref:Something about silencing protein 10 n=1 Tax=Portunus trituberculatus TaxID=210409 RepID=A0A5B7DMM7_PORTR|nr:something about silencing protein 10-like [Portunus trituberculatus]MPC22862.1 Something about silencing protein 10 [Portunus trituberculatus]
MGKRRKTGGGKRPAAVPRGEEGRLAKGSSLLNPASRDFVYDEVDQFEEDRDRLSLSKAQALMARPRASKEQVLGIDVSSSEDDDEEEEEEEEESDQDAMYMEDDIVEEQEERLPDERAWGANKWRYIGTDTTDEKIHKSAQGQDEELERLEEETARKLQDRMAAELEHMVAEDLLPQDKDDKGKKTPVESSVTVDLSGLSRTKKLQLLKRESPEFLPLLEDLKEKLKELQTFLVPLMEGVKDGHITSVALCHYLTTKYRLVLNYVCVMGVYMMTKSSVGVVGQHPVLGRLAQYRQLLQELVPCDEKLRPQLEDILPKVKAAKATAQKKASRKKPRQLQLLVTRMRGAPVKKRKVSDLLEDPEGEDAKLKKKKEAQHLVAAEASSDEEQPSQKEAGEGEVGEESLDPEGKRAITYQIAKNKGLTPSRKKEQRNPRVKYRKKYKNKLQRRKGQVRLVRKEIKRYEGEVSGIKSHTIKSIKIK